jgi:hypothetical protein
MFNQAIILLVSNAEQAVNSGGQRKPHVLNRKGKIAVDVCLEPWVLWPIWFRNEVADQRELTPISEELRGKTDALMEFFKESIRNCQTTDSFYQDAPETLRQLNDKALNLSVELAGELGGEFEVRGQYLCLTGDGHVENHRVQPRSMSKALRGKSADEILNPTWHQHSCS